MITKYQITFRTINSLCKGNIEGIFAIQYLPCTINSLLTEVADRKRYDMMPKIVTHYIHIHIK